jgi:hypothetical protein
MPIRDTRDRSRDRSLERGLYLEEELYGRPTRQSPNPISELFLKLDDRLCVLIILFKNYSHERQVLYR